MRGCVITAAVPAVCSRVMRRASLDDIAFDRNRGSTEGLMGGGGEEARGGGAESGMNRLSPSRRDNDNKNDRYYGLGRLVGSNCLALALHVSYCVNYTYNSYNSRA